MDNEMESLKAQYLQMIQEPICRMASSSALYKGFAAGITVGMLGVLTSVKSCYALFLPLIPMLAFFMMDIYYLKLERLYRYLYKSVQRGNHAIDFSMELPKERYETQAANARIRDCLKSPSIYLFYLTMLIFVFILWIMRYMEVV